MSSLEAALLAAAARTRFYRPWLSGPGRSVEASLRDCPVVTLDDLYRYRDAFRNQQADPRPAEFRHPIAAGPGCVVLAPGFRSTAKVSVIADWRNADISVLGGTKAIAAPIAVLRALVEWPCELLYPVTAFTGPCHGALSESDRDLMWDAFGVPVYEQFLGVANEVLAEDCDAHDGLHVADCARFDAQASELIVSSFANLTYPVLRLATGFQARIADTVCACGRSGTKLFEMVELPRRLAAIA